MAEWESLTKLTTQSPEKRDQRWETEGTWRGNENGKKREKTPA